MGHRKRPRRSPRSFAHGFTRKKIIPDHTRGRCSEKWCSRHHFDGFEPDLRSAVDVEYAISWQKLAEANRKINVKSDQGSQEWPEERL